MPTNEVYTWLEFKAAVAALRQSAPPTSSYVFKTSGSDEPQIVTCGPYVSTHKRHFAQQAQYTICVQHHQGKGWHFKPHASVFDLEVPGQDRLLKFRLKSEERAAVLRELLDYNLTAFSLLGSQESLMETISVREELGGAKFKSVEARR